MHVTAFFLGRVRFRAKTRRLPFDSSHTARALYPDAGALPHARNARSRLSRCCPDAPRRVSRDARTTKSTGWCGNTEWCERSGTLMESARRACLVKATTSCVLPSPWVVWGRSRPIYRERPSSAETCRGPPTREPNDGRGRGSRRSNGRARTRPELNLKFTDGDIAQSRRVAALSAILLLFCDLTQFDTRWRRGKKLNEEIAHFAMLKKTS